MNESRAIRGRVHAVVRQPITGTRRLPFPDFKETARRKFLWFAAALDWEGRGAVQ